MNMATTPGSGSGSAADNDRPSGPQETTPSTDLQSEDAGTADSGTPADSAMKQTSKTPEERESGRYSGKRDGS